MRSTLAALSLLLVHCGDVVAPSADSQADSSTPSAPPLDAAIEHRGTLQALTAIETGDRVIAASLWSEGHENIGVYAFDRDGGRATQLGSFFYRAGITGAQGPIVRAPSIAASGERVAAAFARGARAGREGPWIRATAIEVFALDGGTPMRPAEYEIGAPGLLDGDTRPEFSATITSTRDGWLVLDLLADLRLRVTRVDRDARVLSQRAFSQPLGADGFGIDRWVVRAQRERFWIIAPSEGGRALSVTEDGMTDESARVPVGAQRSPVASPCFLPDGSMDLGFNDERAAWVARVTERAAEPQRTLPWERGMTLRECARPGLWLRERAEDRGYDVVDESTGRASCAAELAGRRVTVAGPLAIVGEQRGEGFRLRAAALSACVGAR